MALNDKAIPIRQQYLKHPKNGFKGQVLAEIRTKDDEYTVDELELMPDDIENGKYLEMYKYWTRGFEPGIRDDC